MRYHIETMGCQMNERDSETIAGMLESLGYETFEETVSTAPGSPRRPWRGADVIVINTCSVRENADNRFFGLLGSIKHEKEARPETIVAVCGCMMQQQHIVDRVKEKYGWVDIVFGTNNIHEFPRLLENMRRERIKRYNVLPDAETIIEDLPVKRQHDHKAFVNIMFGCDNFCTYCIVPYTRGRERSRAPSAIRNEIIGLCAAGTKEITLLGQNVNSYRGMTDGASSLKDAQTGVDFADLITLLDDIEGLERIRFMTSHPKDFSDKLIRVFSESCHLCPAVHLPIQSGSSRVLGLMNRGYTKDAYLSLVSKLRDVRPGIAVTTDLIVGFPGETADDFAETMDVIERVRFDSAFTFIYSPRRGTPAAEYEDQVPEDVKHERFNRMVERLNEITFEKNREHIGRVEKILVEGMSKTDHALYSGRTPEGKLVNFTAVGASAADGLTGRIVDVLLTDAGTFSFIGRQI